MPRQSFARAPAFDTDKPAMTRREWAEAHDALTLALDALGDGPQAMDYDALADCLKHLRAAQIIGQACLERLDSIPPWYDTSPEGTRDRMALFCKWFDLEPVKLHTYGGKVMVSNDLVAWSKTHGVNLDWLLCGNIRVLAQYYRDEFLAVRKLASMTPVELDVLLGRTEDKASVTA